MTWYRQPTENDEIKHQSHVVSTFKWQLMLESHFGYKSYSLERGGGWADLRSTKRMLSAH